MADHQYQELFTRLTGHAIARDWQADLAKARDCRSRVIRIPTGLGKTEGVLAAWSFHAVLRPERTWPRRLVWCLPMRVLVEQTQKVARSLMMRLPVPEHERPRVHLAMGGEDDLEWYLDPERPAIIIGTQDMLLSRALNRGYASSRGRWPTEFGLLHHDALWVMDEVQLMDVGLVTSAQLQAYRDEDRYKGLKPCYTWWMSATLQTAWLSTVDTSPHHAAWTSNPTVVPSGQQNGGVWDISKSLALAEIPAADAEAFAGRILKEHAKLSDGAFGRITLVVCNTVDRACDTYASLREASEQNDVEIELVHSRFRPAEREAWRERFLSREACKSGVNRIIVATQVVEAGVDISAGLLVTERAPWPSLVQRFGRCARYGGSGHVLVVDRGDDAADILPYEPSTVRTAWASLHQLTSQGVGIAALESYEATLSPDERTALYPYEPQHLLLRREFDELFDITPDLTGADLDISRFIRSGDERDLQVFWIDLPAPKKSEKPPAPSDDYRPHRRELCAVPFLRARDWLCGEETKSNRKPRLQGGKRAWVWDWIDGEWKTATREMLVPGRIVCVSADSGGYLIDRGFDAEAPDSVPPVTTSQTKPVDADDKQDGEVTGDDWKTIATHTREVSETLDTIAASVSLPGHLRALIRDAAIWHDWGKAHPAFQGCMRHDERPERPDLAKAPKPAWKKRHRYKYLDDSETRPAFRHELASALGLFAVLRTYRPNHPALLGPWADAFRELQKDVSLEGAPPPPSPLLDRLLEYSAEEFDLLVYLVAAHHGKVRVALHAAPADQDYRDTDGRGLPIRGVREGDRLPSVSLVPGEPPLPEVTLTLAPASMGLSEKTGMSWRERVIRLLKDHGPAKLAYLEAIMVAADRRASRLATPDPLLTTAHDAGGPR